MKTDPRSEFFSGLLPPGKLWFTPPEVAPLIGRTPQYIRNTINAGALMGHVAGQDQGTRQNHRIHRHALLLYLRQSACYEPVDFLEQLAEVIATLPPYHRKQLDKILLTSRRT